MISGLSARVFVNSEAVRRHWARWVKPAKLQLVQYAIEVAEGPRPPRLDGPLRVVLVGDKAPGKGQKDAIEAMALLAERKIEAELTLVGGADPVYESDLRAQLRRRSLEARVRFVDFDPAPLKWVAAGDVALMCSRSEALGRVTVEAMKLGKPVVGTTGGATPELVRDGENGFLYTFGRPEELADRLEKMARDRASTQVMGARAHRWATEHFNRDRYGRELEEGLEAARRVR
jgi:glycosyltransferase involved in cell wall biosynthesis